MTKIYSWVSEFANWKQAKPRSVPWNKEKIFTFIMYESQERKEP